MNMICALISTMEKELADGKIPPDRAAKQLEEIHRLRKRVIRSRDPSKDDRPITVGIEL